MLLTYLTAANIQHDNNLYIHWHLTACAHSIKQRFDVADWGSSNAIFLGIKTRPLTYFRLMFSRLWLAEVRSSTLVTATSGSDPAITLAVSVWPLMKLRSTSNQLRAAAHRNTSLAAGREIWD